MNESQILSLAVATTPMMLVVLVGIVVNNLRLNDMRDFLRAEIKASGAEIRAELGSKIQALEGRIQGIESRLEARMLGVEGRIQGLEGEMKGIEGEMKAIYALIDKNHSEMLHRFGDLDTRLTRIESSLGIRPAA